MRHGRAQTGRRSRRRPRDGSRRYLRFVNLDRYGATKVVSKDVHTLLRRALAPVVKPLGYRQTPGASGCTLTLEQAGSFQTMWVQVEKCGWTQWLGSAFTLEFQWDDNPDKGAGGDARTRWSGLCTADDLAVAKDLQQSVSESAQPLPELQADEVSVQDFLSEQERLDHLGQVAEPYWPGLDIWCRYRDPEHVQRWASFFAERLPAMLDRFPVSYDRTTRRPLI